MSNLKLLFIFCLFATQFSSTLQEKPLYTIKAKFHCTRAYCLINGCDKTPLLSFTLKEIEMKDEVHHDLKLTDDMLKSLLPDLVLHWPVLTASNHEDKGYWKHLYEKHGASRTTRFSPEDYFLWGFQICREHGNQLLKALNSYGASRILKTPAEIGGAIRLETKSTPELICVVYNGDYYLSEIHLCFNDDREIVNCLEGEEEVYCPEADRCYYVAF